MQHSKPFEFLKSLNLQKQGCNNKILEEGQAAYKLIIFREILKDFIHQAQSDLHKTQRSKICKAITLDKIRLIPDPEILELLLILIQKSTGGRIW